MAYPAPDEMGGENWLRLSLERGSLAARARAGRATSTSSARASAGRGCAAGTISRDSFWAGIDGRKQCGAVRGA